MLDFQGQSLPQGSSETFKFPAPLLTRLIEDLLAAKRIYINGLAREPAAVTKALQDCDVRCVDGV
jgi:hypothetical protein